MVGDLRAKTAFRPELHGVRGVALALVVCFHLFANGRISGGIDIFLTITGFLFTRSLLRRIWENDGRLDFSHHFARIAQRLLPPALVVIAATTIAAVIILPRTRWLQAINEARASVLYHENWELIWSQLSYEAGGVGTSPFQHFWSLSIQGQFHLIWPFVMIAVVWLATRAGWRPQTVGFVTVSIIFVASFVYANFLVSAQPEVAYFHTATRVWQLALGGLAGLVLPQLHLSMRLRIVLGWVGLALIATCGIFLDGGATFPGYQSLWPITGLLFVLAAGFTGTTFSADHLLTRRPITFLADISYALYLWHWPLYIFYLIETGSDTLSLTGAAIILGASIVLATLTTYGLERPLARAFKVVQNYRKPLIVSVATLLVVGSVGVVSGTYLHTAQAQALSGDDIDEVSHPGAAVMAEGEADLDNYFAPPFPTAEAVAADIPDIYGHGCTQTHRDEAGSDEVLICEYLPGESVVEGTKTIVIIGGSKAAQWNPAFEILADDNQWRLLTMDKGGCQFSLTGDKQLPPVQSDHCQSYNENAVNLLTQMQPDLVVTLASTARHGEEQTPEGFVAGWEALSAVDIPVLAIRDTPRFDWDVADCLVSNDYDSHACGAARDELLAQDFESVVSTDEVPDSVTVLDLTDYFCEEDYCEAVVGNIAVYRDIHHVTVSYMDSLAPFLGDEIRKKFPALFLEPAL